FHQSPDRFARAFPDKLPFLELVSKRFVGNFQPPGRFFAVPSSLFEHPEDDFLLRYFCGVSGHFFQGNIALRNGHHRLRICSSEFGSDVESGNMRYLFTTFSSCRTLPGQSYFRNNSMSSLENCCTELW